MDFTVNKTARRRNEFISSTNPMVWAYGLSILFFVIAVALSYTILRGTIATQKSLTGFNSHVHELQLSITASVGTLSDYRLESKKSNSSTRLMQLIARRANTSVEHLTRIQNDVRQSGNALKNDVVRSKIQWIVTTEKDSLDSKLSSYIAQMKTLFGTSTTDNSMPQIPLEAAGARYGALFQGYESASRQIQQLIADNATRVDTVHKWLTAFIIIVMLLISAVVVAPLWLRLIAEHKRLESAHTKLYKIAYTDRETGLPNLAGLERKLIELVPADSESGFYLLLVRITNLDQIYSLIGSRSSEALLRAISNRLQTFVTERVQWSRSGEAEFTCLLTEKKVNNSNLWAEDLYRLITGKLVINGVVVRTDIRMAVSKIDKSELMHHNLLWEHQSHAQLASADFEPQTLWLPEYHAGMNNSLIMQNNLIDRIAEGLEHNQFIPFYQLKVAAATGEVRSLEVLARWIRADNSMEPPGVFIPVAESSGLIVPMTFAIFEQVLTDIKVWCAAGIPVGRVAINVARDVLLHPELIQRLQHMHNSLPELCEGLDIEITENIAIGDDIERTFAILTEVRQIGIRVAIDDFGTGYASLETLIDLPFDVLKIDRAFVLPMTETGCGCEVVTAMISLCNTMGKTCVVEGVETAWQWQQLAEMGADELQGFYFHKPSGAIETKERITTGNEWKSAA